MLGLAHARSRLSPFASLLFAALHTSTLRYDRATHLLLQMFLKLSRLSKRLREYKAMRRQLPSVNLNAELNKLVTITCREYHGWRSLA